MIGLATVSDIPRLREIWKACFGDTDSYLDFYYEKGFPRFKTVVDRDGETVTSMLTVVPAFYKAGGEVFDAAYLYAVATDPAFQGKGIASRLLLETHELLKKEGVRVSTLFPAEESLYRFYEKVGYRRGFSVEEVRQKKGERVSSGWEVSPLDRETFVKESEAFLKTLPTAMAFASAALDYFAEEILKTGGLFLSVRKDALQGYVVCYKIKETLIVKETNLTKEVLGDCVPDLLAATGAEALFGRAAVTDGRVRTPHGMLCVLEEHPSLNSIDESGYMNLILD